MTLRENQDTGYDSDSVFRTDRELRREQARVRSMRQSAVGDNADVGRGADEGERGESGSAVPTWSARNSAQARLRRQRIRAGVLGTGRGRGRGGPVQGSAGVLLGGEGGDGGNAMPTVRGRGMGRVRAR